MTDKTIEERLLKLEEDVKNLDEFIKGHHRFQIGMNNALQAQDEEAMGFLEQFGFEQNASDDAVGILSNIVSELVKQLNVQLPTAMTECWQFNSVLNRMASEQAVNRLLKGDINDC